MVEDLKIVGYKLITDRGMDKPAEVRRSAILVRKDLNYKVSSDLMKNVMPDTWVDIGDGKGEKLLNCCMYRKIKKWGEPGNVPAKEAYTRMHKW